MYSDQTHKNRKYYNSKLKVGETYLYYRKRQRCGRLVEYVRIDILQTTTAWVYALQDNAYFRINDLSLLRSHEDRNEIFPDETVMQGNAIVHCIAIHGAMTWCQNADGQNNFVPLAYLRRMYEEGRDGVQPPPTPQNAPALNVGAANNLQKPVSFWESVPGEKSAPPAWEKPVWKLPKGNV